MRTTPALAAVAAAAVALGCASFPAEVSASTLATAAAKTAAGAAGARDVAARGPRLRVRTVEAGLDIPWDITFLPGGSILYTQRDRRTIRLHGPNGGDRRVNFDSRGIWAAGETGLMSILAARNFQRSRHFYTCHGANTPRTGGHDVRVVMWKLKKSERRALKVKPILRGLPATSGRHGGCRLRFGSEGALYICTGDAASSQNAQSLRSGGGKVLRVQPSNGAAWRTNPFIRRDRSITRKIFTYGHRNVQGLALRPDGKMWSVEHGPNRDDEVNLLRKRGNYGWDPEPPYNESVPMTDFSLPGKQIGARWSSGFPTIAPSGATWLRGNRWGSWEGALAMAVLGDEHLRILKFTARGAFVRSWRPAQLDGRRLRTAQLGPDNNLYITTSDGAGTDRILEVVPRPR